MQQRSNGARGWWLAVVALALTALTAVGASPLRARAMGGDDAKKPAVKEAHAERLATFKKEFAACKTSLSAAIETAEAATQGRAHAADIELGRDRKLRLVVGVLAGEKLIEVIVDPDTGKVVKTLDDEADEDEDGDEEGDDDDGDDEVDGADDDD